MCVRFRLGMRWWLALVFAAIAAVTATAVALVSASGSEHSFRERAADLAAGRSFRAAIELNKIARERRLARATPVVARRQQLPIFVFSPSGRLLTNETSRNVAFADIEDGDVALASALAGRRYVKTDQTVRATLVGVPLRRDGAGAIVTYASHPLLGEGVGVIRDEVVKAALWAILLGGAIGFLIASLIARRLARIADSAAAIEAGDFDAALAPRFGDEVGKLSATIDQMRKREPRSTKNAVRATSHGKARPKTASRRATIAASRSSREPTDRLSHSAPLIPGVPAPCRFERSRPLAGRCRGGRRRGGRARRRPGAELVTRPQRRCEAAPASVSRPR